MQSRGLSRCRLAILRDHNTLTTITAARMILRAAVFAWAPSAFPTNLRAEAPETVSQLEAGRLQAGLITNDNWSATQ